MDKTEMDRITAGMTAKAEKVRALNQAGVSTADIGRYLGIRYQHVYNVLLRAGVISKGSGDEAATKDAGDILVIAMRRDGCIRLPDDVMDKYGLEPGGTVFCRQTEGGLVLMSREAALAHVRKAARSKMPEQAALFEALLRS